MDSKILIIDADPTQRALLRLQLEREGFTVAVARSGREGLQQAYRTHPDAVLLDIVMQEAEGWATLRRLRQACDVPILVLTARPGRAGAAQALTLGADDWLAKPFRFEELLSRIHALLRRGDGSGGAEGALYDDGWLRIDRDGSVTRDGEPVHLTPTESRLLVNLVRQRGKIVRHRDLVRSVWGPGGANAVGRLSVYIRYLRQKIEVDPRRPRYLCVRWGVGYYFAGHKATKP
jgi:two-component system KDP operon response regulator KdpE